MSSFLFSLKNGEEDQHGAPEFAPSQDATADSGVAGRGRSSEQAPSRWLPCSEATLGAAIFLSQRAGRGPLQSREEQAPDLRRSLRLANGF